MLLEHNWGCHDLQQLEQDRNHPNLNANTCSQQHKQAKRNIVLPLLGSPRTNRRHLRVEEGV
jgi:hypothetical protein